MDINLPGLANVDDVNSVRTGLPEVRVHVNLEVLGAQVALSCKEHLNVLGSGIENRGELRRSHFCDLTCRGCQICGIVWRSKVCSWSSR
jgi:hypothetical protein